METLWRYSCTIISTPSWNCIRVIKISLFEREKLDCVSTYSQANALVDLEIIQGRSNYKMYPILKLVLFIVVSDVHLAPSNTWLKGKTFTPLHPPSWIHRWTIKYEYHIIIRIWNLKYDTVRIQIMVHGHNNYLFDIFVKDTSIIY